MTTVTPMRLKPPIMAAARAAKTSNVRLVWSRPIVGATRMPATPARPPPTPHARTPSHSTRYPRRSAARSSMAAASTARPVVVTRNATARAIARATATTIVANPARLMV